MSKHSRRLVQHALQADAALHSRAAQPCLQAGVPRRTFCHVAGGVGVGVRVQPVAAAGLGAAGEGDQCNRNEQQGGVRLGTAVRVGRAKRTTERHALAALCLRGEGAAVMLVHGVSSAKRKPSAKRTTWRHTVVALRLLAEITALVSGGGGKEVMARGGFQCRRAAQGRQRHDTCQAG